MIDGTKCQIIRFCPSSSLVVILLFSGISQSCSVQNGVVPSPAKLASPGLFQGQLLVDWAAHDRDKRWDMTS